MRYKFYIIAILTIIILLAAYFLFSRRGTFSRQNTLFAVEKSIEITGVNLKQGDDIIRLRKTKEGWIINESGEARGSAVSFLLQTITEIVIKSPVSEDIFQNEILNNGIIPVRVEVFAGRRRVKSFLVYKTDSNIYGNVMRLNEGSKPFITSIPGYEGSIASNFNMNELFWMPFNIFSIPPSSIEAVEVTYAENPNESFKIYNPGIKPGFTSRPDAGEKIDSMKVKRYLSYFTWVPFESWDFTLGISSVDSIRRSLPFAKISVSGPDGKVETLNLWHRPSPSGESGAIDTDRAWGSKGSDGYIFIARYFDLDPLLRKKSYFFPDE